MAQFLIGAAQAYLGIGILVAVLFLLLAVGKVVEGARGSSPLFRLIVLPGAAVLWPVVLWKWRGVSR